jgi:DNA modification methylase
MTYIQCTPTQPQLIAVAKLEKSTLNAHRTSPQQFQQDRPPESEQPVYAKLPRAPKNASPVPHLTSLYHFDDDGRNREHMYPGNCGGNLIKDLMLYFKPGQVLDPMSGSGTCAEVCKALCIPSTSFDIHQGFDACDGGGFPSTAKVDLIWSHPPYWRLKLYADDPRDLSRSPTLEHFLSRYGQFIRNCDRVLKPGGKLAILMGDYRDREAGFVPLTHWTKRLAFAAGLQQHCIDIIRFSHGTSSSKKVYPTSFIPTLHDVCMIFEKQS